METVFAVLIVSLLGAYALLAAYMMRTGRWDRDTPKREDLDIDERW